MVKPWVWIVWLFFGPMLQSVFFQFYIFIATRTLALTELLVTELVFEHSLRIRFKAETDRKVGSRVSTAAPSRAESPVGSMSSENAPGSEESSVDSATAREASEVSTIVRETSSASTATLKGTVKAKTKSKAIEPPPKEDPKKRADGNLVGKINNLITADLQNITSARDFLWLGEFALCSPL
jgi:hypothetical protein